VAGQAKADAPSEGVQYHHVNGDTAADGTTGDGRVKGTRPTMGSPDIIKGRESCQLDRPFLLDQQRLLPNNGIRIHAMPRFRTVLLLLSVAIGAFAATAGVPGLRAEAAQMSVDEIRPGMVGIGRTVFEGTRVEEFKVHVLGVLQNVVGPHRSLILARLEGGPLATTGVIAGMSGSPVYIDGKLIGAVSYALGAFPKEPIAGITPIAEMTDATSFNDSRPTAAKVHVEFPLTRDGLITAFRKAL